MRYFNTLLVTIVVSVGCIRGALGQSFGVELQNTLMPASGGMAGTSIARPQDLTSAINANPASLTQFKGTQFLFGGAWAEPTFNMTQTNQIPLGVADPAIRPFSARSTAPGTPMGNIGVTQDLSELGLPATFGIGFVTTAGGFVDFRQVPNSNGTNTGQAIFNIPMALGLEVTERLSIGAGMALGIAFFDGPFVGASGMTPDYALRGTLGANYLLTDFTTLGFYYQTQQSYTFDNAVVVNPGPTQQAFDVQMDLPQNLGWGIANTALCDGCLLVALDITYKLWDQADMYSSIYNNQLVVQLGTQYTMGRYKYRAGYAWAENPLDDQPNVNVGGVPLGSLPAVRYTESLLAITSQNRISFGIGVSDVLPGIDLDMMAGGMFKDTSQQGPFTTTSIESYWIGFGLTWRFGRGAVVSLPAPDSWN